MERLRRQSRMSRAVLCAALLLGIVAAGARNYIYAGDEHLVDDDYLWLYMTAAGIGREAQLQGIWTRITAELERTGNRDAAVEAEVREAYASNYIAASMLYRGTAEIGSRIGVIPPKTRYPAYVASSLAFGFWVAFLVAVAGCVLPVFVVRQPPLVWATMASLVMACSLESIFPAANQYILDHESGWQVVRHCAGYILNPSFNFSPFGVTPRSQFALLMVGVFAFRITQYLASGYALLAFAALFHQSSGAMAVIVLLFLDVVFRSEELLRRGSILAVLVAVAAAFLRPHTLSVSGVGVAVMVYGCVSALLLIPLAVSRCPRVFARWWPSCQRNVHAWASSPLVDVGVIMVGILLTLPIVSYARYYVSPDDWLFLWSQLHGRLIGIVRPALFLALSFWAFTTMVPRMVHAYATEGPLMTLMVAGMLLSPTAAKAVTVAPGQRQLAQSLDPVERSLRARDAPGRIGSEMVVYYSVAKTLDTGVDWTGRLFTDGRK